MTTNPDPRALPVDVRTVGDLRASDVGARITIPDLNVEEGTILSIEHYSYEGEVLTDLAVTRHGGLVMKSTVSCVILGGAR